MFSDSFKSSVERDAEKLANLAFRLVVSSSTPYSVDSSIVDDYVLNLDWCPTRALSRGGIVDGSAYVDLALFSALKDGSVSEGFSYIEDEFEGVGFQPLHQRPYYEVLACLIAHEVSHAAIFFLASREPTFGVPTDHGHAWQSMYRFLRSNLLFLVGHGSVTSSPVWCGVVNQVIASIPELATFVEDCADRTYEFLCISSIFILIN